MDNEMDTPKFAHVATEYQAQGIQWLRLSPGSAQEEGVFILLYKELSKPCLYDYWFENLEIAKKWAEKYYGVNADDWTTADDLIKRGIQIIDEI